MNSKQEAHIFWDNSNTFIPAQSVASRRDWPGAERGLRIHFANLLQLARAGRTPGSAVCVGSRSAIQPGFRNRLTALGVAFEFYERGAATGKEQGVDQCLQIHMLRRGLDAAQPGIAVLLTGDGAGYRRGEGFHADMERLHRLGWGIEVLAWQEATNSALRSWAESVGVFVPLDEYFESITFIEGGRIVKPVSLIHRHRALPQSPSRAA